MVREGKGPFDQEPEVIEVSQYDIWKEIKPGEIGVAEALGPCFGLIIYNPKTKHAIVGHFVSPKATTDFDRVLEEGKKLSKKPAELKAYVGGNTLDSDNAPDFTEDYENRELVEKKLKESGFQIVKISYATSTETTDMKIDTRTGVVDYIQHEDMDDVWSKQEDE